WLEGAPQADTAPTTTVELPQASASPAASAPRRSSLQLAGFAVAALALASWIAVSIWFLDAPSDSGGDTAQADAPKNSAPGATPDPTPASPRSARPPTRVLPLFGPPELDFGRRLDGWERTLGPGTFGDDEDSSGVVGLCMRGLALKPVMLGPQASGVRGTLEPLATPDVSSGLDVPPRACGIALEWSEGRRVAVALLPLEQGVELAWCALARSDAGSWSRSQASTTIERRAAATAFEFQLRFDGALVQLAWTGANGEPRVESAPAALAGSGAPVRFYLWTEDGALRCARLELEES
ncbi:MAG: hypothetical protein ACKO4Q_07180, partial [Planctomycetota bacterium]